jgi:hypothetical protein
MDEVPAEARVLCEAVAAEIGQASPWDTLE